MKIQRYRSSSFPCEPIRVLFPTHSFIQEIRVNVWVKEKEEKGVNEEAGGLILPTHSKGCHLFWFKSFPWVIYGFSKKWLQRNVSESAYSKFGKLSLLCFMQEKSSRWTCDLLCGLWLDSRKVVVLIEKISLSDLNRDCWNGISLSLSLSLSFLFNFIHLLYDPVILIVHLLPFTSSPSPLLLLLPFFSSTPSTPQNAQYYMTKMNLCVCCLGIQ